MLLHQRDVCASASQVKMNLVAENIKESIFNNDCQMTTKEDYLEKIHRGKTYTDTLRSLENLKESSDPCQGASTLAEEGRFDFRHDDDPA